MAPCILLQKKVMIWSKFVTCDDRYSTSFRRRGFPHTTTSKRRGAIEVIANVFRRHCASRELLYDSKSIEIRKQGQFTIEVFTNICFYSVFHISVRINAY